MDRGLGAAAEGDDEVHEVRVLGRPLEGLAGAHGPAEDGAGVGDPQVAGDELVLGTDVVVEGYQGEGAERGRVGGGGGLPVAEEGGDDDVVVLRVEGLVGAGEPEVLGDYLERGVSVCMWKNE